MGQKVSPVGLRVGVNRNWSSRWYANKKDFSGLLHEDIRVRKFITNKLKGASVASVEIERTKNRVNIYVHTARPGIVIGKDGESVDALRKEVAKMVDGKQVFINIVEVKNPDTVAYSIAEQLENRASFRTVQKRAIQRAMRAGAKGIKTSVSGRLGGADIARSEGYSEGVVPLHTLRADIDYATAEADTTYGKLGVKVWICKGEILPEKKKGDK